MSETSSNMESSTGETESTSESAEAAPKTHDASTVAKAIDDGDALGESPLALTAQEHETAREVAARHFARLMYAPQSTWSRYVFHENDPHPFGARQERGES
ncbi:MAG TPA: hypothetical protein VFN11_00275 [Ktedonobacterales bacterium]|nr:hypothetical protein [Ktedonobacterales bacterium]